MRGTLPMEHHSGMASPAHRLTPPDQEPTGDDAIAFEGTADEVIRFLEGDPADDVDPVDPAAVIHWLETGDADPWAIAAR